MTDAERRTAQALLVAEGAALVSLRATIRVVTDGGATRRSLPAVASRIEQTARGALRDVRLAAKRTGSRTVSQDLAEVLQRPVPLRAVQLDAEDEARIDTEARELSAGIVLLADRRLQTASSVPGRALAGDIDGRVRRAAATHTSEAFNLERDDAAAEFARRPENTFLPVILRRWNAMFDACLICRGLHGQSRPLGINYEDGQRPGGAHPFCRCFSTIMPIPLYLR